MAYSWLYSAVGTVIRKFDLELYETNEENVRIVRDCFNGQTAPGLNLIGVRVIKELD
jgi:hypothetical protein